MSEKQRMSVAKVAKLANGVLILHGSLALTEPLVNAKQMKLSTKLSMVAREILVGAKKARNQ